MTDWDQIEREVVEANARANDEAARSPRYIEKRELLRKQIEDGIFDGEIIYEDEDFDGEEDQ